MCICVQKRLQHCFSNFIYYLKSKNNLKILKVNNIIKDWQTNDKKSSHVNHWT